ncbi:hypothetical protein BKA70DRAFT_1411956 [Coprinopsis sp. MPI-PUGE-AT-0042]|nr:hypothetical protein BKA70DRAFT_1411956 [Coprinopsis sp. MPI-PUGE-AT-0042]
MTGRTGYHCLTKDFQSQDDVFNIQDADAQGLMNPPSAEELDSFHVPTNLELASHMMRRALLLKYPLPRALDSPGRSSRRPSALLQKRALRLSPMNPPNSHLPPKPSRNWLIQLRELITAYEIIQRRLQDTIQLYHCAESTVRLVPDEILLNVLSHVAGSAQSGSPFVDCMDGSAATKVAVALTCRRWNQAVFKYPELWTSVRFDCSSFKDVKLAPATVARLTHHIGRAQLEESRGLQVELAGWQSTFSQTSAKWVGSKVLKVEAKFLVPLMECKHQWSTLSIHAHHLYTMFDRGLLTDGFPSLESLTILGFSTAAEAEHISGLTFNAHKMMDAKFPKLRSLSLIGLAAGEAAFPMVSDARSDARLKNITHLSVRGPSACYSLFAYLDKLPALTSLTVEGGHNYSRVLYLTGHESRAKACEASPASLSQHGVPVCPTGSCVPHLSISDPTHNLHHGDIGQQKLLLLSSVQTGSTGLGDSLAISNLADSLFRLLSITANNPIYLPLLQRLLVNLQKEPRKLPQFDTVIRNNLNIAQLSQFCRSRLEPPNGITLSPVLNRVCVRDQSQSPVDREEEPIYELRTWARQNVPELDFRVWFDDT